MSTRRRADRHDFRHPNIKIDSNTDSVINIEQAMAVSTSPETSAPAVVVPPHVEALARLAGAALDRALSQQLTQRETNRPRLIRTAFWPSDLFTCRRKVGLAFREVARDEATPRLLEVRHWGNVFHEEYYRRLAGQAAEFRILATEQPVKLWLVGIDTPLRGKYDVMVEAPAEAIARVLGATLPAGVEPVQPVRFLVDIKSVTPYVTREVAASGRPQRGDAAEMACYLRVTDLPFGIVVYHDKTSGVREIAPVVYDEAFFQEIVDWIRSVYEPVRAGEIPPRDYDPEITEFPCTYCPFRTVCLELGPGPSAPSPTGPATSAAAIDSDDTALRTRAQALLDKIVQLDNAAREANDAALPLRRELEEIVRQLGRVENPAAAATLAISTRWDLAVLAARLNELGRLPDAMELTVKRVQQLVKDGALPASLLAEARRSVPGGLRIVRRSSDTGAASEGDGGGR